MRELVTWKRNETSTSNGESVTLTINFSSFNSEEIDELEKLFREHIKTAMIIEYPKEEENESHISKGE